jgi:hypothetical protein
LYAESPDKSFFVGKVISDTSTFEYNFFSPPLKHIFKSKNKIEIRLKIDHSLGWTDEFIILSYDKTWRGKSYKRGFTIEPSGKTKEYIENKFKSTVDYDTLFSKLVQNDIFSLKLDDVDETIVNYNPEKDEFEHMRAMVLDGTSYYLQFKVGNQFRAYGFSNPQEFTHVTQLRQFVRIINLLQNSVAE